MNTDFEVAFEEAKRRNSKLPEGVTAADIVPWHPSYRLGRYYGSKLRDEHTSREAALVEATIRSTEYADQTEFDKGFNDGWEQGA